MKKRQNATGSFDEGYRSTELQALQLKPILKRKSLSIDDKVINSSASILKSVDKSSSSSATTTPEDSLSSSLSSIALCSDQASQPNNQVSGSSLRSILKSSPINSSFNRSDDIDLGVANAPTDPFREVNNEMSKHALWVIIHHNGPDCEYNKNRRSSTGNLNVGSSLVSSASPSRASTIPKPILKKNSVSIPLDHSALGSSADWSPPPTPTRLPSPPTPPISHHSHFDDTAMASVSDENGGGFDSASLDRNHNFTNITTADLDAQHDDLDFSADDEDALEEGEMNNVGGYDDGSK